MFPKASLLCASPIEIAKPNEWKFAIIILLTKEGKFQKAERRKIERSALFTKPRQQVYPPFRSEGDAEKMHVQEVDLSKSDLGMQIFFRGRKDHVIGRWTCYPRCPRLMIAIPAKRRMPPRLEEARHKRGILQRNGFSHPTRRENYPITINLFGYYDAWKIIVKRICFSQFFFNTLKW